MTRFLLLLLLLAATPSAASEEPSKELTNSIGMKFVLIPAGEFVMGSQKGFWSERDERPQHKVRISKPFYLGIAEVTQAQYECVMEKNPSLFAEANYALPSVIRLGDTSNLPVESVPWNDAVEFCKKLSVKEGRSYRLPTEAEWEYACRAGTTTKWNCGDTEVVKAILKEHAWYGGSYDQIPSDVAQKKPNAWGLHDMYGNVSEWCSDWYSEDYYANSPKDDPSGPDNGSFRIHRGGSLMDRALHCRSASRGRSVPSEYSQTIGFRIVLKVARDK